MTTGQERKYCSRECAAAGRYGLRGARKGRNRIGEAEAELWHQKLRQAAEHMGSGKRGKRVRLVCGVTSMYNGLDGLTSIIRYQLRCNPYDGSIYVFRDCTGSMLKYIEWDGQGFLQGKRRAQSGTYPWPNGEAGRVVEISEKEFHETRKDDRAKPLHIMLDTEHGARVLGRHALHWDAGNAIELLFRLCDLCQEPRSVLVMMLLCLMAPLYDTLYPLIGSLACNMSGITATPPVLQAVLAAFAGDECWEGKHWKVYIPHIWTPKVPLGGFSPSTDLRDYAELRIQWQEMTIRLAAPCRNRLLVLEAGVPASIRKQIRKAAPLGIPVMLGKQSGSDATYCPRWTELRIILMMRKY